MDTIDAKLSVVGVAVVGAIVGEIEGIVDGATLVTIYGRSDGKDIDGIDEEISLGCVSKSSPPVETPSSRQFFLTIIVGIATTAAKTAQKKVTIKVNRRTLLLLALPS